MPRRDKVIPLVEHLSPEAEQRYWQLALEAWMRADAARYQAILRRARWRRWWRWTVGWTGLYGVAQWLGGGVLLGIWDPGRLVAAWGAQGTLGAGMVWLACLGLITAEVWTQ